MKHLLVFCATVLLVSFMPRIPNAHASRVEDYYYKLAVTWPFTSYSPRLQERLTALRLPYTPTDVERVGIPLSGELGIYWPITVTERYLLVGINCTFVYDQYRWTRFIDTLGRHCQEESVFFGLFSGTLQYYPLSIVSSGPFVRFDMGLAMGNIHQSAEKMEYPGETWTGLGVLGGVGYVIPALTGTHLTVEAWYAVRNVQKYYTSTLHMGVGVMW